MIRNREKIIQRSIGRSLPRDHEFTHVETLHREVNERVLLCMVATEPLQIDDQDGRDVVDLDFLHCLLVVEASVAVPGIRLGQLFWPIELPEAVINADALGQLLTLQVRRRPLALRER